MRGRVLLLGALLSLVWLGATPSGQQPASSSPQQQVEGELLVTFRPQADSARRDAALAAVGGRRIKRFETIGMDHVRLPRGRRADEAINALRANGDVIAAQPNFIRRIDSAPPPNDPAWLNDGPAGYNFWGMKKIQADLVWFAPHNITGDSTLVVADIDTGVDYTHPDLAANMWVNPGEIAGNGIDDDANGYADDVHGINVLTHSGNPMDDHGHGTHTSGTFGAVGNNGIGVVGVNWNVKILACKFLDATGSGSDAGAIECFNYITAMKNRGVNIRVSNNSWGSERDTSAPFPQLLKDAIDAAGNAGILNVFAAGNGGPDGIGDNTDLYPHDPSSFTSPSIVSVAASRSNDGRAGFSNYGATSVDLAAPGVTIISTWIDVTGCIDCYAWSDGTSMAAPHVAGAAALLLAKSPALTVSGLKSLLISSVTTVGAWSGRVASGGRLNVYNAANTIAANTPPSVSITSPASGATFTAPASVTISANASDAGGSVTSVAFFAGTTLLGTDTTSPFSITSAGIPAGSYALTAKATDNLGATTTSAPVAITVGTPITPSITLSAASLTFAKQLAGTTSAASQTVSVTNNGPGPLVFVTFNGAAPASSFTVAGDFPVQTDCPLTPSGLAAGASCTFTVWFSPTAAGVRSGSLVIGSNAAGSPHSVGLSGTAFVVDEATVAQSIGMGGTRLQQLQQANGGWFFAVSQTNCGLGEGVSCPNLIGVTALGLLSAYDRNPAQTSLLTSAVAAGQRLLAVKATVPTPLPFSQDLEFLIALSDATSDPQYAAAAADWFGVVKAAFPDAASRVDHALATRGTLAGWDMASLIRSAKAGGDGDYAVAAAARIFEREADWAATNPTNELLGKGSLLWAVHDLGGFTTKLDEYRSFLLGSQDSAGTWGGGNLQVTSYAVMGLAAMGGSGTDTAIRAAVASFIANQLPTNGWPFTAGAANEYSTVDAEILRAVATLYSTPMGSSVAVNPAQLSKVTFSKVSKPGTTTMVASAAVRAKAPAGYRLLSGLSYDVTTSAEVRGQIAVCVAIPWAATSDPNADIRLLHLEGKRLVDRTIRRGPLAAGSDQVCARVKSLDGFAVAVRKNGRR